MALRLALTALLLLLAAPGHGQQSPAPAERVKAAFLYKFIGYVEWPASAFASAASPMVIGVAGDDAIAADLEAAVRGRKAGMRPLQVVRLDGGTIPPGCCHVLFAGRGADAPALLGLTRGLPVLTVSDAAGEAPDGSIINFVFDQGRVRFDIHRGVAERNGLQLRSQLLGVARKVTPQ